MITNLEREIEILILKVMLAAGDDPVTDGFVRAAIRTQFQHIAMTAADIGARIGSVEEKNLIAGTNDEMLGLMWALTPKGKIKAQQLK
jgi:hypothetical protein